MAAISDEISGFWATAKMIGSCIDLSCETIDQANEFINYAKERIGDGGWGEFLMEIAEGMIPPGCVERGWDYCAGYVVTTLVLSAAAGGVAKLLSKADTILDATPNVGTRNRTDSDSGRSVTDCRVNSFDPGTEVLMADGSHAPIEDVELGDVVWAVDPESGVSGPRPVTALIEGYGTKELVDITVDGDTVVATDEHPFWVVDGDSGAWVDAQDLKAGDVLLTPEGVTRIDEVEHRIVFDHTVHNLTVAVCTLSTSLSATTTSSPTTRTRGLIAAGMGSSQGCQAMSSFRTQRPADTLGQLALGRPQPSGGRCKEKPCVDCGTTDPRMIADHIDPLVVEHYRTGSVDVNQQRTIEAVQPHCSSCSPVQGGQLSAFSRRMRAMLELNDG